MADRTILERKSAENGAEKSTANRPFNGDTYENNRYQEGLLTHQASNKARNEKTRPEGRVPFQAHNEESHTALLLRQSQESLETANQHISAPAAVAREPNISRKNGKASTAAQTALRQHQAYGSASSYGSMPGMIPGMHYQTPLRPSIMSYPNMPIPSGQSVVKEKALRPMQTSAQHSAMSTETAVAEAAKLGTTRERTSTVAQPVAREQSSDSSKKTNRHSTMSSGKAPAEARNIRANSEKTSVLYTAAQTDLRQHQHPMGAYGSSLYGSMPGMIAGMQYQIPLRPSIMPHPSMPIPSPYLGVPSPYYTSPTSPYAMQYPPGVSTLWPYGPSLYPTPGLANRVMHHSPAAQDKGLDLTKPPKDKAYLNDKQRLDLTKPPKDQAYLNDKQRLDLTKLPKDQDCALDLNEKQRKLLRFLFKDYNYFPSDEEFYAIAAQTGYPVRSIKRWFDLEMFGNLANASKNLPLASSINVKEYVRSGRLEPASEDTVDATRSRVERAQKHRAVNAQTGPHAAKKPRTLTGDPGLAPEVTTNQIQTQQNPAAPTEGTIRTAPLEETTYKEIDTSVRFMPQDYFANDSNIYSWRNNDSADGRTSKSSVNRWMKRRNEILSDPNFDTDKYSIHEDTVHNLAGVLDIPEHVVKDWCKRLKDSKAVTEPKYALETLRPSLRWLYVPGPIKMSDTRKFYLCEYCASSRPTCRYKLRYFIIHQYHFFQTNKCEETGRIMQWFAGRFNTRYGSGETPALNGQLEPEGNSNPESRTNYNNMQHVPEIAQLLDNPLKAESKDPVADRNSQNTELLGNPSTTTPKDLVIDRTLESYITPRLVGTVTCRSDETIVEQMIIKPITPKTEPISPKLEPISPKLEPISPKLEPISPKLEPISPKLEPNSPKLEPNSSKLEPISPKLEPISPKLEPISPKLEPISPKPEPISPKPEPSA